MCECVFTRQEMFGHQDMCSIRMCAGCLYVKIVTVCTWRVLRKVPTPPKRAWSTGFTSFVHGIPSGGLYHLYPGPHTTGRILLALFLLSCARVQGLMQTTSRQWLTGEAALAAVDDGRMPTIKVFGAQCFQESALGEHLQVSACNHNVLVRCCLV